MRIIVDAPLKTAEIQKCLQDNQEVKYEFVGTGSLKSQLIFDVDNDNAVSYTKGYIKKQMGNLVVFRVLEEGKNW